MISMVSVIAGDKKLIKVVTKSITLREINNLGKGSQSEISGRSRPYFFNCSV